MSLPPKARPLCICIVTGEPSGDLLGARLMAALRRLYSGPIEFMGVGGESMAAQGLASLVDQRDLAVMGFIEVVPKIPVVLRHVREVTAAVMERRPNVVITIDSWGFTKRLQQSIRQASADAGWTVPRLHYVAPMVWAWKEKRAREVAETVDRLLCLLPQEPAYFTRHGLLTDHVGHSVIEGGASCGDGVGFRQAHSIAQDALVLTVLPGSRRSETSRLLPVFADTVRGLCDSHPNMRVVIPTVATVAESVELAVKEWPGRPIVVRGEQARYDAFAASQAALAASGTVSLELALAGLPHLVAYRVAPFTAWLFRKLSTLRYANLINHALDEMVIPEVLQEECTAPNLVRIIEQLFSDPQLRARQQAAFSKAMTLFGGGEGAPSERAARIVLDAALANRAVI
jgi:lipid-A-disaccharide synthase